MKELSVAGFPAIFSVPMATTAVRSARPSIGFPSGAKSLRLKKYLIGLLRAAPITADKRKILSAKSPAGPRLGLLDSADSMVIRPFSLIMNRAATARILDSRFAHHFLPSTEVQRNGAGHVCPLYSRKQTSVRTTNTS